MIHFVQVYKYVLSQQKMLDKSSEMVYNIYRG